MRKAAPRCRSSRAITHSTARLIAWLGLGELPQKAAIGANSRNRPQRDPDPGQRGGHAPRRTPRHDCRRVRRAEQDIRRVLQFLDRARRRRQRHLFGIAAARDRAAVGRLQLRHQAGQRDNSTSSSSTSAARRPSRPLCCRPRAPRRSIRSIPCANADGNSCSAPTAIDAGPASAWRHAAQSIYNLKLLYGRAWPRCAAAE